MMETGATMALVIGGSWTWQPSHHFPFFPGRPEKWQNWWWQKMMVDY
jgi:hypothetical protein